MKENTLIDMRRTTMYNLLLEMGVTPNYVGCVYTVCAVLLVLEEPWRLQLVTKWLYPEVAKQCCSTNAAIEKGIRTIVKTVWNEKAMYLQDKFKIVLPKRPTAGEFISMLYLYIETREN